MRVVPLLSVLALMTALPVAAMAFEGEEVVSSARAPLPSVVTTSEETQPDVAPRPMTTEEQIAHWLATSPARTERALDDDLWPEDRAPRRVHSQASVSVGTGGYSSAYVATQIPLGDKGWLGLSYAQTDHGDNSGYGWGYGGYGADYAPYSYNGPGAYGRARGGQQQSFGVTIDLSGDSMDRTDDCTPGRRSGGFRCASQE